MRTGRAIPAFQGPTGGEMLTGRKSADHIRGRKRSFSREQCLNVHTVVRGVDFIAIFGCKAIGCEQSRPAGI